MHKHIHGSDQKPVEWRWGQSPSTPQDHCDPAEEKRTLQLISTKYNLVVQKSRGTKFKKTSVSGSTKRELGFSTGHC